MTLLQEHRDFALFVPYMTANRADGRAKQERFEFRGAPRALEQQAMRLRASCCVCRAPIRPFRRRRGGSAIYMAVCCESAVSSSCFRTHSLTDPAVAALERAILAYHAGHPQVRDIDGSLHQQPGLPL